jgi:hypothetical protein
MGFDTMESFLLSLNDTILHIRYVNKKIVLCSSARGTNPGLDNPLANVTKVRVCYRMWKIFILILVPFVSVIFKRLHNTGFSLNRWELFGWLRNSLLWTLKFHYHVQKIILLASILSQFHPVQTFTTFLLEIHFNILLFTDRFVILSVVLSCFNQSFVCTSCFSMVAAIFHGTEENKCQY